MTKIFIEDNGFDFPKHWRETYEVCDDRGYGAKVAEYEQVIIGAVIQEMRNVKHGTLQPEPHHQAILDHVKDLIETTVVDEWLEELTEILKDFNYEITYED
jgi:hypothetical protein